MPDPVSRAGRARTGHVRRAHGLRTGKGTLHWLVVLISWRELKLLNSTQPQSFIRMGVSP